MGVHALAGAGGVGTPVGAGASSTVVSVDVVSEAGGLVLDVLYGNNSTTGYTAGAGQTEHWDTNTTSGLNNLRGAGSEEVGASSVTMSWTANVGTNLALLAVSFNPGGGGPPDPVVPGAPSLTSATGGNGSVGLAWTPPASDGGSPVTTYEVWRGESAGGETLLTTVGNVTSFTDTTVTNGTPYYYQVAAVNAVGSGPRSNEQSATPQAAPPTVTRTGGTASNFAAAFSASGSVAFTLPPGSNRLVAMVSLNSTSVQVSSVTWRPNAADPSADQALTFVGRQTAPANGSVEIWELASPTPGVPGSAVSHVLSGNAKRVMGVNALAGVGSVGTPVGAGANATTIGVSVASASGGLVLDVLYGNNSTTGYTAGAGQTEAWDTNTTKGLNNLRGCGSEEAGAGLVSMTWTANKRTNMALLAVTFTP
jgi:hypothetical protein